MAGWNALFHQSSVFEADATKSAVWNRGAYLVEGLAHCGACHTPRNALGAEKRDEAYAGGESEGWIAPALNAASPAAVPWDAERLRAYLRTGYDDAHGVSAGPMAPVVGNLAAVPEAEVGAIATYVAFLAGAPTPAREELARKVLARAKGESGAASVPSPAIAASSGSDAASHPGAAIYVGACAQCHGEAGRAPLLRALNLALSSTLRNPRPDNAIRIIRGGIHPLGGGAGPWMPPFGDALTDAQLVALIGYLRAAFTESPSWNAIEDAVKRAREMEAQEMRAAQSARNTP